MMLDGGGSPPTTPTGLAVANSFPDHVQLTWNPVAGADMYVVADSSNTPIAWVTQPSTELWFTSSGYGQPSTSYGAHKVKALNAYGSSAYSSTVNVSTSALAGSPTGVVPATPTIIATPSTQKQIRIICSDLGGDDRGIAYFHYEKSADGVSGWTPLADPTGSGLVTGSGPTQAIGANCTHQDVTNGATWYYRCRTEDVDTNLSSYSPVISGTTTAAFSSRTPPTLPQLNVDVTYPSAAAVRTINCTNATQLQNAFNDIQDGDHIVINGVDISGNFTIPARSSAGVYAVIRTDRIASVPARGIRVVAGDSGTKLRKLTSNSANPLLTISGGAQYLWFEGIECLDTAGSGYNTLISATASYGSTSLSDLPKNIIFSHCYIHHVGDGSAGNACRHGIAISPYYFAVVDSTMDNFIDAGLESQCIWGFGGVGPMLLQNNYARAAGESLLQFAEYPPYRPYPAVTNANPADITIEDNDISNDPSWSYSVRQKCKNLLEFKHGKRILVQRNTFHDHWTGAQQGAFFVLTPRANSWSDFSFWNDMSDITFKNNLAYNVAAGLQVGFTDDGSGSGWTPFLARVAVTNNLLLLTGEQEASNPAASNTLNSNVIFLQFGAKDLLVQHNTVLVSHSSRQASPATEFYKNYNLAAEGNYKTEGTELRDNIFSLTLYNATRSTIEMNANVEPGTWIRDREILLGLPYNGYSSSDFGSPATNMFFPANETAVGFINRTGEALFTGDAHDYALTSGSTYHNAASDGTDVGCDMSLIPTTPKFGAYNYIYNTTGDSTDPVTLSLNTQTSGSRMLLIQLMNRTAWNAPTDDNGNTVGAADYDQDGYYGGQWSPYGMRVYEYGITTGGTAHVVRFTNISNPTDETTFIAVEIKNSSVMQSSSLKLCQAAGAGVPYTSNTVTTTGPALLISCWAGDGASGDHDANPPAGWTKFAAVNRPNTSYIQGACAYKYVQGPGTYSIDWTPTSNEGAIVILGAWQ